MEFRYVIYKREEFYEKNGLVPGIGKIFRELMQSGIVILECRNETILDKLREAKAMPEDTLLFAATDMTINEVKYLPIANIGYANPNYPKESLFSADILIEGFAEVDYWFLERIYQRKHGFPWRVIDTERCYLREMTEEDLPELFDMYAGKGMTDYMEPLYAWEEELEYTRAYIANMYRFFGYGMWLVKDRYEDKLIGRAGLNHLEFQGEVVLEMGYAIAVPFQKKGYATEVCEAIIDYAKGADLGYEMLYCFVWKGNIASVKLLEKLGFVYLKDVVRDEKEMELYGKKL
ncbi:MAG: GNAT family N-acetyltransferase [Lachnospiraceae bacterium]|nr:GNAT family N-acetyltransferase [Lachnospiraceae bacterium]